MTVTKDGLPVAELNPVRRKGLAPAQLIARARLLPRIDPDRLRQDIDSVLDQSL